MVIVESLLVQEGGRGQPNGKGHRSSETRVQGVETSPCPMPVSAKTRREARVGLPPFGLCRLVT